MSVVWIFIEPDVVGLFWKSGSSLSGVWIFILPFIVIVYGVLSSESINS